VYNIQLETQAPLRFEDPIDECQREGLRNNEVHGTPGVDSIEKCVFSSTIAEDDRAPRQGHIRQVLQLGSLMAY
jgi:hypothetical protein